MPSPRPAATTYRAPSKSPTEEDNVSEQDQDQTGLSRRSLIKRGAIVGGAAVWAAPVVQSFTSPAGAATPAGSPPCSCCTATVVKNPNGDVVLTFLTAVSQAFCDCVCTGGDPNTCPAPAPVITFCPAGTVADANACACV
jgi:hypothetical protein